MDSDEAFRQQRIATIRQVRTSIVRISYKWKLEDDEVPIPGTIVSKTDHRCVILADRTFHEECKRLGRENFSIRFPITDELYGDRVTYDLTSPVVTVIGNGFIRLDLDIPYDARHYVSAATFQTGNIRPQANVDVFFFPRDDFAAPPLYFPGSVVDATPLDTLGYLYADVPVDEYTHFGSPLFNHSGHIVAIICASQSRVQAWGVEILSKAVLHNMGAKYA